MCGMDDHQIRVTQGSLELFPLAKRVTIDGKSIHIWIEELNEGSGVG